MRAAEIPTAPSKTFSEPAALAMWSATEPVVVKASGLAAGRVRSSAPPRRGKAHSDGNLAGRHVWRRGKEVVVESFLEGEELSILAISNGIDLVVLPPAQDHKRLREGDLGPNTGGMGAYSPVSLATPDLLQRVERQVFRPALQELARCHTPFTGVLYAGLMVDRSGSFHVIEFNCRFGDPEAQVILPRIRSGLLECLLAAAKADRCPRSRAARAWP
jgi:phosphoribosylamine--glycine ligase